MPVAPSVVSMSQRYALLVACLVGMLATSSAARASENPLNSSEKRDTESSPPPPPAGKTDFTIVPVVGGSTDIGIGGGFFAGLTRDNPKFVPYVWNLEAAGFLSVDTKNGAVDLPFADIYAKLSVVHFLGAPLRLEVRPSFTDELTLYYYGMGNASSATPPPGQTMQQYFEYARRHPELFVDVRFKVLDHFAGRVGVHYVETWFDIPNDSKLGIDLRNGSPEVKSLIGPTAGAIADAVFRYGLQLDTRDNETSPHKGTFDELALNISPGGTAALPYRYGEASANLRAYTPLFSKRVTLAARAVADVLFGDVPLYELSRAVDTYALGGSNGVRGIPAQRYYGKVKILGNLEVRAKLFDFHAFGKALTVAGAAFFDGGRVWADTTPQPALDGTSFGLKYGAGGGLRLMSGSAFVLRGDLAWSPDATPIGGYLVAGEIF